MTAFIYYLRPTFVAAVGIPIDSAREFIFIFILLTLVVVLPLTRRAVIAIITIILSSIRHSSLSSTCSTCSSTQCFQLCFVTSLREVCPNFLLKLIYNAILLCQLGRKDVTALLQSSISLLEPFYFSISFDYSAA